MRYTIQVSDHPEAGRRIATEAAAASWKTVYDGAIDTAKNARLTVDGLSDWHKHVRCFRGENLGKLWYGVFR